MSGYASTDKGMPGCVQQALAGWLTPWLLLMLSRALLRGHIHCTLSHQASNYMRATSSRFGLLREWCMNSRRPGDADR